MTYPIHPQSVDPASHESFDVTVAQHADTQGQLDHALARLRHQLPEDRYVIQEINLRGTVFTGGNPADLDHNRKLARRNEDYVHQYLTLAGVRPQLQGRAQRHVLAPQAQSDTQHNAVRVDVVYRKRGPDELARTLGVSNPRCSKRAAAAPDAVWLRRCPARQHA